MKRFVSLIIVLTLSATFAFGDFLWFKTRDPVRDVEKIIGQNLTDEEKAIAGIVMAFYSVKYGYAKNGEPLKDAVKRMSEVEYKNATAQAAKLCKNDAAKGFFRMGKAGEKLLKAIIQTVEDGAKAAGDYIEKKSNQYDKKK
jgi:hypothetical protein